MVELKETFSFFDKDGDGFVTAKEIGNMMRYLKLTPSESDIYELVNDLVSKGNEKLNEAEFLQVLAPRMKRDLSQDGIREAFKIFNRDNEGYISAAELRHCLTNYGEKLTNDEINDMIREADLSGDGRVDLEKFIELMSSV